MYFKFAHYVYSLCVMMCMVHNVMFSSCQSNPNKRKYMLYTDEKNEIIPGGFFERYPDIFTPTSKINELSINPQKIEIPYYISRLSDHSMHSCKQVHLGLEFKKEPTYDELLDRLYLTSQTLEEDDSDGHTTCSSIEFMSNKEKQMRRLVTVVKLKRKIKQLKKENKALKYRINKTFDR